MSPPRVVILGGGPAGVAAAWQLRRTERALVTVVEQRDTVGGNAGSFVLEGIPVDYGSHRLHPACAPEIMGDLQTLLGSDLLRRPRHGRIRLRDKWVHFPIRPLDLLSLPWSFGLGVATDVARKVLSRSPADGQAASFASVLEHGLGRTICRDFYFPYAFKIWGLAPEELSAVQARRRVSAGSLQKMAGKVLGLLPGLKPPDAGIFYYPREGYGQISQRIADAARAAGADIRLETSIRQIRLGTPHLVEVLSSAGPTTLEADYVWSTIPITVLARLVDPPPPLTVRDAATSLSFRAMILIYLVLEQSQFTPFDAHYFPEADVQLTRLSEPKNYSARSEPRDRTVLCGELPCTVGDTVWEASDTELGELARGALERSGLPIRAPILRVVTKRLPFAYPIYRSGYEEYFEGLDQWAGSLDRVLSLGRQGLFAHDNTHHTVATAYAAVDCLANGEFDAARWQRYRAQFETHVVED